MSNEPLGMGAFSAEVNRKRARAVAQLMGLLEDLPLGTLVMEDAKADARDIVNNFSDYVNALLPRLEPSGLPGEVLEIVTEIRDTVVGAAAD